MRVEPAYIQYSTSMEVSGQEIGEGKTQTRNAPQRPARKKIGCAATHRGRAAVGLTFSLSPLCSWFSAGLVLVSPQDTLPYIHPVYTVHTYSRQCQGGASALLSQSRHVHRKRERKKEKRARNRSPPTCETHMYAGGLSIDVWAVMNECGGGGCGQLSGG